MATNTINVGDLIYEAPVRFTKIVEYGVSLNELVTGSAIPPTQGARIDVHFEGSLEGQLRGTIIGVDYLLVRADGHFLVNIHGHITTWDNVNVSFFADGIAALIPGTLKANLRENVTLLTADPKYKWINQLQGWGQGVVDLEKGGVTVKTHAA